ncbi:hypothetical protein Pan14r_44040 [Crateriforma conspicua]|uniref:Uncharacterized protein n=1 Tax=Crateriforma conspicua TaxID=2527996 RepID=A0A5C5Y8T3_9PLAN|nr:hypothetical protein Pan14r_44040 [Crateriforma conspicua]
MDPTRGSWGANSLNLLRADPFQIVVGLPGFAHDTRDPAATFNLNIQWASLTVHDDLIPSCQEPIRCDPTRFFPSFYASA